MSIKYEAKHRVLYMIWKWVWVIRPVSKRFCPVSKYINGKRGKKSEWNDFLRRRKMTETQCAFYVYIALFLLEKKLWTKTLNMVLYFQRWCFFISPKNSICLFMYIVIFLWPLNSIALACFCCIALPSRVSYSQITAIFTTCRTPTAHSLAHNVTWNAIR